MIGSKNNIMPTVRLISIHYKVEITVICFVCDGVDEKENLNPVLLYVVSYICLIKEMVNSKSCCMTLP